MYTGIAVAELGWTPAISMIVKPTPPRARSSWYAIRSSPVVPVECAVRAMRLGTVHAPIWSGSKKLS